MLLTKYVKFLQVLQAYILQVLKKLLSFYFLVSCDTDSSTMWLIFLSERLLYLNSAILLCEFVQNTVCLMI